MNKNKLIMTVATISLMTGMSTALAQQEPPRGAPAEKIVPKAPGNAPAVAPGAADSKKNAPEERGDHSQAQQNRGRETTTGQAPQAQPNERREPNRATEDKKGTPNRAAEEKKLEPNSAIGEHGGNERNGTTVGQGKGSTNVTANITPEQRTRIHEVFVKQRSAPRVDHVDFSLSVGTAIPRSVHIITVPQSIVEIQPTWRGYEYFMVGNQIVIVDPRSMEIVAVLDA